MSKKYCVKCLLREMDQKEYYKNLYDYMERLDPEIKVEPDIYEERLAICKQCERLYEGMCKGCGCFVELRALIVHNVCPYDLW